MTMNDPLSVEKSFWSENQEQFSREYAGMFLLIKGTEIHGVFDSHDAGVTAGVEMFGRGPFWVCSVNKPEPDPLVIPALFVGVPLVTDH